MDATSGTAGVAHWLNSYFRLKGDEVIPKTDPLVTTLRDLVAELYAQGRNTVMGDEELEIMVRTIDTERYEHLLFHKSHCYGESRTDWKLSGSLLCNWCTVQLTSIRIKVDFVVPHGFTFHIRVNIPRNAVPDIKIDMAEVLPRGQVLEHTA